MLSIASSRCILAPLRAVPAPWRAGSRSLGDKATAKLASQPSTPSRYPSGRGPAADFVAAHGDGAAGLGVSKARMWNAVARNGRGVAVQNTPPGVAILHDAISQQLRKVVAVTTRYEYTIHFTQRMEVRRARLAVCEAASQVEQERGELLRQRRLTPGRAAEERAHWLLTKLSQQHPGCIRYSRTLLVPSDVPSW